MAYLSGYSKYKVLTLTGGADGALTDHQLKITVSKESAMQGDFDDLRFTQADGETLVDAWAELIVTDTSATVWVEFTTTPANTVEQTYYMYYGNSGVASDWDGAATFPEFFDDFPGTSIDTGKWDGKTSNASVSGGIMSYGGDNTMDHMRSINQFGPDIACRAKIKFLVPTSYIDGFGFENFANTHHAYIYAAYTPVKYARSKDGTTQSTLATNIPTNSWFTSDVCVLGGTNMSWFYDGVEGTNSPKTTNPANTNDMELFFVGRSTSTCVQAEWVFARKYVANPPTYEFGTEQSVPTGRNPYWYYNLLKRRN